MTVNLIQGDCIEEMQKLIEEEVTVDLILTDPPYGTTANKWDSVIPLDKMWGSLTKLIKPNGIIALFSSQPFTSVLISSNLDLYRYNWVWDKCGSTGFLNSNYAPLKSTEDVCIFSKGTVGSLSENPIIYYPQGVKRVNKKKRNNPKSKWRENMGYGGKNKLNTDTEYIQEYTNYPSNILKFKRDQPAVHPTQKPVGLLEYLIKTYTKEKEVVLDFTMGSGSTGVACLQTGRDFIGIELDDKYYELANERCKSYQSKLI